MTRKAHHHAPKAGASPAGRKSCTDTAKHGHSPSHAPGEGEQPEAPLVEETKESKPLPESITGQRSLMLGDPPEEWWGTEADLGDDAWGAAIVSVARTFSVIGLKRDANKSVMLDVMDLIISFAVMLSNLALQALVLWYIMMYVVEPLVHNVQVRYRHFRAHVMDKDGNVIQDAWDSYEFKDDACEMAMGNVAFYYVILLLWILTNMSEWRAIERLNRSLGRMQTVQSLKEQLLFTDTGCAEQGGACLIIGLTRCVRISIYALVIIPRLLFSFFLTWLGMRWLTSSESFSDMVLNSLALGFVISIDELLCQAILPVATRKHMEDTNLFMKEGREPKKLAQIVSGEWQGFKRTILLMVASGAYLVVYGEVLQQVLPKDVRLLMNLCKPHVAKLQQPVCSQAAYQDAGSCYPAGVGDRFDEDE